MAAGAMQNPGPPPGDQKTVVVLADRRPKPDEPATKGGNGPPPSPPAGERKFAAKRWNEGVKVWASWMNTLAGAAMVAGFITPAAGGLASFVQGYSLGWVFAALVLHGSGQAVIRFEMKSEE